MVLQSLFVYLFIYLFIYFICATYTVREKKKKYTTQWVIAQIVEGAKTPEVITPQIQ